MLKRSLIIFTLIVILAFSTAVGAADEADVPQLDQNKLQTAIKKALDYLAENQNEDGSWDTPSRGRAAAIAGLALMAMVDATCGSSPAQYQDNIEKAIAFLKKALHSSAENADKPDIAGLIFNDFSDPKESTSTVMYSHGIATIALIEAYNELKDPSLSPIIRDAIGMILRSQNTENKPQALGGPVNKDSKYYGGWRYKANSTDSDTSVVGWQIIALKAAKQAGFNVPAQAFEAAATSIRACYDKNTGGFTYQPGGSHGCARTGIGILSLQLTGYPNDPYVGTGIEYIKKYPPEWEEEQVGWSSPFYYWYYATRAMYLAGGENWKWWSSLMCSLLIEHQNEDGSWDAVGNESGTGKNYTAALGALMLEICCGKIPGYMKPPTVKPSAECCEEIADKIEEKLKELQELVDELRECCEEISEPLEPPITCDVLKDRICIKTGALADIVFVIDSTGTMQEEIVTVYSVSQSFADKLADSGVNYQLGLVEFKDRSGPGNPVDLPYKYYGMTEKIGVFKNWVGGLSASGGGDTPESTLDALAHAANDVPWREGSKRVIILISDAPPRVPEVADCGDDSTSPYTYDQVEAGIRSKGIVVHVIGYKSHDKPCYDKAYAKLVQLASSTGGNFYDFDAAEGISKLITDIGQVISCTFALQMTAECADGTLRLSARITDPQGSVIEPVEGRASVVANITSAGGVKVGSVELKYNSSTGNYEGNFRGLADGAYTICLQARFCEWTETICGEISCPTQAGQIETFKKGPISGVEPEVETEEEKTEYEW